MVSEIGMINTTFSYLKGKTEVVSYLRNSKSWLIHKNFTEAKVHWIKYRDQTYFTVRKIKIEDKIIQVPPP